MPYPAKAVANAFLDLAEQNGKHLSPMKLQKLVYFAHGWFLALTGKPLIEERIQAWQYGPVIPNLYQEFKQFGNGQISERATDWSMRGGKFVCSEPRITGANTEAEQALSLIKKIWQAYGHYSAVQLSNATHAEGTPWKQAYIQGSSAIVIPDETIKSWFEQLRLKNEEAREAR